MDWRYQFEAVLCAILLLSSILLVSVRSLGVSPAIGGTSSDQVQRAKANSHNITSWTKQRKPISRLPHQIPELETSTDAGSLWDQGPAYDLSRDDLDY